MKFSVFQISRRGGREKNEDRMGYCYTRESGLFVLADGMGGHPEGEVAAQIALQTVSALFQRQAKPKLQDVQEFLSGALLAAHHQILRYATEKGMIDTPRTTLVAAVLQGGAASWVHCGDSRLYMVRDGELLTRTRDHSYLELRNAPPPGMDRVNRNVLFTCLGSPTKPIFDITGPVSLEQGDRLLLCSDGLWGTLSDGITKQLARQPVSHAVPELVEEALRKAGDSSDNVTVVALESGDARCIRVHPGRVHRQHQRRCVCLHHPGLPLDGLADDLDDAAIERSIAEINEAIRRSAARRG